MELYQDRQTALRNRILGVSGFSVLPLQTDAIPVLLGGWSLSRPFICFISAQKDIRDAVLDHTAGIEWPFLHLSSHPCPGVDDLADFDRKMFHAFVQSMLAYLSKKHAHERVRHLVAFSSTLADWPQEQPNIAKHNLTTPNRLIIESVTAQEPLGETLLPNEGFPHYVKAILDSAQAVRSIRDSISLEGSPAGPRIDLILACPSMSRHVYRTALRNANFQSDDEGTHVIRRVIRLLQRQDRYVLESSSPQDHAALVSEMGRTVLGVRRGELDTFTLACALKGASTRAPVVRLPAGINKLQGRLIQIGDCARGNSTRTSEARRRWKLGKLARALRSELRTVIPSQFSDLINRPLQAVKLIGDAPLEWLDTDGLPLALLCNTSRIPATPGNVSLSQCIDNRCLTITEESFHRVLVVRSFDDNDEIKYSLEKALSVVEESDLTVKVEFVDVSSADELCSALNGFDGALAIFDCHASHDAATDVGGLVIGGESLDVWSLRESVRVPPIIVTSACDTHPLDRSHASSANGLLMLGAKTVLATVLPIRALNAAIFVARLIWRLRAFLPLLLKYRAVRWIEVISGLQRMQVVTEIMHRLMATRPVSEGQYQKIGTLANQWINQNRPDWFDRFCSLVTSELAIDTAIPRNLLGDDFELFDSLKYIQLGNPEDILIVSSERITGAQASLQAEIVELR